jgi:hypothetical protein
VIGHERWLAGRHQFGDHPVFHQIRLRATGRSIVIWQKLDDGCCMTRVDADGRVGQATGRNRARAIAGARAAVR